MLQPDYRVRLSNLPCRIKRLKTIRRFLFHPVAHGYLLGAPSKKLRALYSRQRRYNPFGKQIAVRRLPCSVGAIAIMCSIALRHGVRAGSSTTETAPIP
jgi:hypothetical protein